LPSSITPTKRVKEKPSLTFWMRRVIVECDLASVAFAPDPVHDLRVALRRCCSMADGIRAIDPDPTWKEMKKAGKRLFRKLGELRDLHVMQEWVHNLDRPGDTVTGALLQLVTAPEAAQQQGAQRALQEFDRKQWVSWSRSLPQRVRTFPGGSPIFRHLALEAWTVAHRLHGQTLRRPTPDGFHRLRIGVKRFRYIVENFLPIQHAAWSNDLKKVQDLLGDVHDLDVLWTVASGANIFPTAEARLRWQQRIDQERAQRVEAYKKKTVGDDSLWRSWRADLPRKHEIKSAALLRLKTWASLLDPDFGHSMHVSRLALQLYDGLAALAGNSGGQSRDRVLVELAALLHEVGRSKGEKGHHKRAYKMIRQLAPPLGWRSHDLLTAGIIARYHRGAFPVAGQEVLRGLSPDQRREISRLAAILRLANAFDASRDRQIQRLEVKSEDGFLIVAAQGYSPRSRAAEGIAAGRHLLETVYRCPVLVRPLKMTVGNRKTGRRPRKLLTAQPARREEG